ncbi:hypothetical protein HMF8227_00205 [Saliniradius amylolyticus]|uniref:SnoaL-like domain-containing protein n=2 Tax=Saliniradius amylolyticus TaxID=2183582 RepID=A0A2S2DZD1_9ALTE|nr:hypothetical protein HMF8227_00205 [Saliniradius amylolyticus]
MYKYNAIQARIGAFRLGKGVAGALSLVYCLLLSACTVLPNSSEADVQAVAHSYFETYAERSDFDRFMRFYADDAKLTDIVYGNEINGKDNIRDFFDWHRGDFTVVDAGPALEVEEQVISGNQVITKGVFREFEYNGNRMGPWKFIIWQELNQAGKVIAQEDWINYTPKKIMLGS